MVHLTPEFLKDVQNARLDQDAAFLKLVMHAPVDIRRLVFKGGMRLARQIERDIAWLKKHHKKRLSHAMQTRRKLIAYRTMARCSMRASIICPGLHLLLLTGDDGPRVHLDPAKDKKISFETLAQDIIILSCVEAAADSFEIIWTALKPLSTHYRPYKLLKLFTIGWSAESGNPCNPRRFLLDDRRIN